MEANQNTKSKMTKSILFTSIQTSITYLQCNNECTRRQSQICAIYMYALDIILKYFTAKLSVRVLPKREHSIYNLLLSLGT